MTKRIVNLVTQMEGGGAQRMAITLTEKLNERGYQCETWFLYKKRPIYDKAPNTYSFMDSRPRNLGQLISLIYSLLRKIRLYKPLAIITYSHYANIIGCFMAWLIGVPTRIARQESFSTSRPILVRVVDWLWGVLGLYTYIVAVSKSIFDEYKTYPSLYRKRLRLIYNGIDTNKFELTRQQAREHFQFAENEFVLVNVGRLSAVKNQILLLKMMIQIDSKLNCKLIIAGEGEERSILESFIENNNLRDRVFLLGELPPEEVRVLFRAADLFVFPSLNEGFSIALLEAISFGLPTLVSDIPSCREILGVNGVYLPPNDPVIWAKWVERLYFDKKTREFLVDNSLNRSALFHLDQMVNGHLKIICSRIGE